MRVLLLFLVSTSALGVNIKINKVRDMIFPIVQDGTPAATIAPGAAESAEYLVTGDPGASYIIFRIVERSDLSGPGTDIDLNTPVTTSVNSYTLDASGQDTLYMGLTRAAIPVAQTPGDYLGEYLVRVQYSTGGKRNAARTDVSQKIAGSIGISKVRDLAFPAGQRSDPAYTIAPTDGEAAEFQLLGNPNLAYTITLPTSVTMIKGNGNNARKQIVVNTFTSSPAVAGTLDASGSGVLRVGATRAAILANQVLGSFSGTFLVTVSFP